MQKRSLQISNDILIPEIAKLISQGHTVTLPLRGYSMRPWLEDGRDKALLAPAPETLNIGDVVLAEISTSRYALHRIVEISEQGITLCGDGNITPEYIQRADVIAIATGFYRKGSDTLSPVKGNRAYTLYWKTWIALKPLRRYLLFIYRKFFK